MALSVRFRLRVPAPGRPYSNPHGLQVRITVNAEQDSGFSVHLKVDPSLWDQKEQKARGRSDEAQRLNGGLLQVKADLERIERMQMDAYKAGIAPMPTCATVKSAYLAHQSGGPRPGYAQPGDMSLSDAVRTYAIHLRMTMQMGDGLKPTTIRAYERNIEFLTDYYRDRNQREPLARLVTPFWIQQFRYYLFSRPGLRRKKNNMATAQCNLVCRQIAKSVNYLHNAGLLPTDPLGGLKLSAAPTKDVYFLDPVHLKRLWVLSVKPRSEKALWWMKIMCLTGLDYPDAIRYVADRERYDAQGIGGAKIVIRRNKKPFNECHIPMLDELVRMLDAGVSAPISRGAIKYHFGKIQALIGFEPVLCPKVCRKTAGSIFILKGYSVKAVSNILGHSRTSTTEKHYVRITGHTVDQEQAKLNGRSDQV